LKPGFHFTGSRVETRRFQATYSPTDAGQDARGVVHHDVDAAQLLEEVQAHSRRGVAAQVAFEKANFETRISLLRFKG
jgi:hypothetical protein